MILRTYYTLTDEEQRLIEEKYKVLKSASSPLPNTESKLPSEYREILREVLNIDDAARDRYILEIAPDYDRIIDDVQRILDAAEKDDFVQAVKRQQRVIDENIESMTATYAGTPEGDKLIKQYTSQQKKIRKAFWTLTNRSAVHWLRYITYDQSRALTRGGHSQAEYIELTQQKADTFYKPKDTAKEPAQDTDIYQTQLSLFSDDMFMKTYTSPASTALLTARERDAERNPITGMTTINTAKGVKIQVNNMASVLGLPPVSQKMLKLGEAYVAQNNDGSKRSGDLKFIDSTCRRSFKETALLLGYKIDPKDCNTPAEIAEDRKRVNQARKEAAKQIKTALGEATRRTVSVEANGKYMQVGVLSPTFMVDPANDLIQYSLDPEYARHLIRRNTLTQLPAELFSLSNKSANAFPVAVYIFEHDNMDSNILTGTHSKSKVSTLLSHFPDMVKYEELPQADKKRWKHRIAAGFEKTLDDIVQTGALKTWAYYYNGQQISRDRAKALPYNQWSDLMIEWIARTPSDRHDRIDKRVQRKQAAGVQPKKRGRPKKNKD